MVEALLIINTILLLGIAVVLGVVVYRLERARRVLEEKQRRFEGSLETLAHLTDGLERVMSALAGVRGYTGVAEDIGRIIRIGRRRRQS